MHPPGPPTEIFFGPGPAPGQPKQGQNRSVGVSDPSKTVGHPQGTWKKWVVLPGNSSSSQSYAQNTFLACFGGFLTRFGAGWGRDPVVGLETQKSQILKMHKKFVTRVLTKFLFRLLKDPKRLGLGQNVPFGPHEPQFSGPKNTRHFKYQNVPKMAIFKEKKTFFVFWP